MAAFRAGADEVEVAYVFLERPEDAVRRTFARDEVPALEAELSAAIAAIHEGDFRPTPSEFACAGCPALDVVCAGPRPAGRAAGGFRARRVVHRSYVHEARKRVGPKRERVRPVIERLAAAHPDAVIALRFRNDLELLVSVMLSAQTTDVTVNRVTEKLFQKYQRPEDYLAVPPEELEADLRPTGTFRQKARNVRGAMKVLIEEYDGQVPTRIEDLVRLPGVGRKTANVVAAERGATQGVVVDTHVRRLSQRLGFTRRDDPVKIERDLMRLVPREDWARFPHLLIWHGRRVCIARAPRCAECVVNGLCPSSRV